MVTAKSIRSNFVQQGSSLAEIDNAKSSVSSRSFDRSGKSKLSSQRTLTEVHEFKFRTADRSVVLQPRPANQEKLAQNSSTRSNLRCNEQADALETSCSQDLKVQAKPTRYSQKAAVTEFTSMRQRQLNDETPVAQYDDAINRMLGRSATAPVTLPSASRHHSEISQLSVPFDMGPADVEPIFTPTQGIIPVFSTGRRVLQNQQILWNSNVQQKLTPQRSARQLQGPSFQHLPTIDSSERGDPKSDGVQVAPLAAPTGKKKGNTSKKPNIGVVKSVKIARERYQSSVDGPGQMVIPLTVDGMLLLPLYPLDLPYRLEERTDLLQHLKKSLQRLHRHMKKNRLHLGEFFKSQIDREGNVSLDDIYYFLSHMQRGSSSGSEEKKEAQRFFTEADFLETSKDMSEEIAARREHLTPEMIQRVIEFVDPNGDGMIEMKELERAFSIARRHKAKRREQNEKQKQEFYEKSSLMLTTAAYNNSARETSPEGRTRVTFLSQCVEEDLTEEENDIPDEIKETKYNSTPAKKDLLNLTATRFGASARQHVRSLMNQTSGAKMLRVEVQEIQQFCTYLALWADNEGKIELNVLNDRIAWLRVCNRAEKQMGTASFLLDQPDGMPFGIESQLTSKPSALVASIQTFEPLDKMNSQPVLTSVPTAKVFDAQTLKEARTTKLVTVAHFLGHKEHKAQVPMTEAKRLAISAGLKDAMDTLHNLDCALQQHRHTKIMSLIRSLDRYENRLVKLVDLEEALTESLSEISHNWVRSVLSDAKKLLHEEEECRKRESEEKLLEEAVETMRNGVAFALRKLELLMKSKNLRIQDLFRGQLFANKNINYITPEEFKAALNQLLLPPGYAEAQYMRAKRMEQKKKEYDLMMSKEKQKQDFLERMKQMEGSGLTKIFDRIDKYCCRFQMRIADIFSKADFNSQESLSALLADPTRLGLPQEEVHILLNYLLGGPGEGEPNSSSVFESKNKNVFDPYKLQSTLDEYRKYKRAKKNLLRTERQESLQLLTDRQVITILRYLVRASGNTEGYSVALSLFETVITTAFTKSMNEYFKELPEQEFPGALRPFSK